MARASRQSEVVVEMVMQAVTPCWRARSRTPATPEGKRGGWKSGKVRWQWESITGEGREKRIVRGVGATEIVEWRIDLLSGLPQWRTA
jgi:hypothetical protein